MIYKLFSDCFLVKGVQRSTIYDLRRHSFRFIPNDLYDILVQDKFIDTNLIKKNLNPNDKKISDEYIEFLLDNEFIFYGK
jgi:hypothetical protein